MKTLEFSLEEIEVLVGIIKLMLNTEEISRKQGLPKILYDHEIMTLNNLSSKLLGSKEEDQYSKLWDGKEKVEA
jgi:hypothetical protein